MKKYTLLFIALFIVSCSSDEEELPFYVADNGVTIKARDWVTVGTTADLNGVTYTAVDLASLKESDMPMVVIEIFYTMYLFSSYILLYYPF